MWAHNSHVGDARHTQMGWHGEHNIGQLVREAVGDDCVNVGFTTHHGTVTAAQRVGRSGRAQARAPLALPESYEELLHESDGPARSDAFLVRHPDGRLAADATCSSERSA